MRKTFLPLTVVLLLLLSGCTYTFQRVTPAPSAGGVNLPAGETAPSGGPVAEVEPGEEAPQGPAVTQEVVLPGGEGGAADSPWEQVSPQKGDLLLWYALPPQSPADLAFNRLVDAFNAANSRGLTVYAFNLSTPAAVLSRTLPLLGTPDVPALVALTPEQLPRYGDALLPLNELLSSPAWGIPEKERSAWTDILLKDDALPADETPQYSALPVGASAGGMLFNLDWTARLGYYDAPASTEDFAALVCKAAQRPYAPSGEAYGYAFVPSLDSLRAWTQVFGGTLYDPDLGDYRFSQEAAVQALTYLQTLYAQGCITLAADARAAQQTFAAGTSAVILEPVDLLGTRRGWSAELPFNWQVDALPGGTLAVLPGLRLAIPRSTPERELAAWLFLRYALSPEAQTDFAAQSAWFPLQAQAVAQSSLPPRYGKLYKALLLSPPYGGAALPPGVEAQIAPALKRVLQGASPRRALEELQTALERGG